MKALDNFVLNFKVYYTWKFNFMVRLSMFKSYGKTSIFKSYGRLQCFVPRILHCVFLVLHFNSSAFKDFLKKKKENVTANTCLEVEQIFGISFSANLTNLIHIGNIHQIFYLTKLKKKNHCISYISIHMII